MPPRWAASGWTGTPARSPAICKRWRATAKPSPSTALSDSDVLTLWDSQRRHGDKGQQTLDRHFWPQAVALAPQLSIDDRARLFAPLWGEETTLTAHYRQLAHTLHVPSAAADRFMLRTAPCRC